MDNEQLLNEIGQMMDQRFEAFGAAMDQRFESFKDDIATVVAGNAAELHTQIQETEGRLNERLAVIESSVQRIGDAQMGQLKALVSFMEWAQRTDDQLGRMLKRIDQLEAGLNPPTAA